MATGGREVAKDADTRPKIPSSHKRLTLPSEDPEKKPFDIERKKRRLEAKMAALLQQKREYDDSLQDFQMPSSPSKHLESKEQDIELEAPSTPELHEEEPE